MAELGLDLRALTSLARCSLILPPPLCLSVLTWPSSVVLPSIRTQGDMIPESWVAFSRVLASTSLQTWLPLQTY